MSEHPLRVIIGPISDDPAESVSGVNRAIMAGLANSVQFVPSRTDRRFGTTRQSQLNFWNIYYVVKHTALWLYNILRHRPAIAHYAINSGWALRKGLLFLGLARRLGLKTIGHLHSGSFLTFWSKLPAGQKAKALRQLNQLDALVVLSDTWKRDVAAHIGVGAEKLHVVNNPIDRKSVV